MENANAEKENWEKIELFIPTFKNLPEFPEENTFPKLVKKTAHNKNKSGTFYFILISLVVPKI